jgi:Bacteriophage lambda head decoration protein D
MASITIGQPYGDHVGILGTQRDAPRQLVRVTVQGNQVANQSGAATPTTILAGSCIGIVSATGKALLVNSSNTDGSQTLAGVLEHSVETAAGDVSATVYLTGSFLADKLLFGGVDTVSKHFNQFTGKALAADLYAEPSSSYPGASWS